MTRFTDTRTLLPVALLVSAGCWQVPYDSYGMEQQPAGGNGTETWSSA